MKNFIVLVTAKTQIYPHFLALTPEARFQLTCAWSHLVGFHKSPAFEISGNPQKCKHAFIFS